jgi:hypothetical protein
MSSRKLGRKGKLDRDLPFREPKTFAIFPKCFVGREFFSCERVFQGSLGPFPNQASIRPFHQSSRAEWQGISFPSVLQAPFCKRPGPQRSCDCWHNIRDGCRAIDALDSGRAGTACGVRFYRDSLTKRFRCWRHERAVFSVLCNTGSSVRWGTTLANASNNIVNENSHPQPPAQTAPKQN